MKIFTPMLADSKILIAKIKNAHDQSSQKWLYIKDIDIGDKRANLRLLIYSESAIFKSIRTFIFCLQRCARPTVPWDQRTSLE